MSSPAPIYTNGSCRPAYQLNWALSVFHNGALDTSPWLNDLKKATEPDGVRILQHRFIKPGVSQFLLSTAPDVAPSQFVRSVKGRLQHLVRDERPKAFRRNYGFRSVGSVGRDAIEDYVRSQVKHHPMADPDVQQRLERFQIRCRDVDLSQPQSSGHAVYSYNLHVVFVHDSRYMQIREGPLQTVHEMILNVSASRGYRLSSAGVVPDHIHLAVGCNARQAPADVVLCYMNNLAFACGMKPIFEFGFYVGTFGEYDLGVTW